MPFCLFKDTSSFQVFLLITSKDNCVRFLATAKANQTLKADRFSPFKESLKSLIKSPGCSTSTLYKQTKQRIKDEHQHHLESKLKSLQVQGTTSRLDDKYCHSWSKVVCQLSSYKLSFILNAVSETLPTNANLTFWKRMSCDQCPNCGKRQTLLHVLNNCPVLLNKGLYTHRHDSILRILYNMARLKLPKENSIYADLECSDVPFPSHIINSRLRPDIIIWNERTNRVYIIELMVCYETNFQSANQRRCDRYTELVEEIRSSYNCQQINISIGSRGIIDHHGLDHFLQILKATTKECKCLIS